ncbi:hypothetical protein ALP65_01651 [Pseudomonas aeruginosa]|uniref:VWFA domain-containing protein n=11 Tax=Gammaproteobacteria TaxID=1236 RepID=A0A3M5D592_PSEAI|nr:hypothetical protein ALP65_01651 [Pseudomonas aeruginosa]
MFEFAWPWVFALAPLPWLLRLVLPAADSGEAALKVSFLDELESLAGRRARARLPAWRQQVRFALLWFLLLLAAARPQWVGDPLPLPASGRDLLLAVDVSGSMDYRDMRWQEDEISRLELIKKLFGDFIEDRRGDRVGLILFGSQAYLQAPLTFDRHTVRVWLDEAQIGIAGKNTAIGDAIGLAVKRLRQRPAESRVLVLITDGANTGGQIAPQIAAQLAAEQQVKIYTIGIGADPQQGGVPGLFGFNPGLDLDEPTLRGIAESTGGEYFRARSSAELESISATLDRLEPVAQQTTRARPALALLAGFFGSQPQTRLQLLFETVSGPLERLLDGEADLILHRVDKSDPRLEWLDLCRVGLVPVIAPGLLGDPPPRPVRPEQLRPFAQCVMRDSARHSPPTDYFMLAGARQCSVPDQRTKKEVILQGLGWGHLPDFLVDEELADGRLLALAGPHLPGRSEEVVAARRRDRAQGPVAERLWAFLRDNATALRESGMDTGGDDSAGARRPR